MLKEMKLSILLLFFIIANTGKVNYCTGQRLQKLRVFQSIHISSVFCSPIYYETTQNKKET